MDNKPLAKLLAAKFIARPDLRAIQTSTGEYRPDRDKNSAGDVIAQRGFDMKSLLAHLSGEATYGHYMIGKDDQSKLFVLDVDLETTGRLPRSKFGDQLIGWQECNPREFWMTRQPGPGRDLIKYQLKTIGNALARAVADELGYPAAVAYSGSKGIHVYGFTGLVESRLAREAGQIVARSCGWELSRGNNFFKYHGPNLDIPEMDNHQFSLEVYPKQDTVQDLGNLVRLPCGVNRKSPRDRAFFLDMRTAMTEFTPMDPVKALTTTDIWAD